MLALYRTSGLQCPLTCSTSAELQQHWLPGSGSKNRGTAALWCAGYGIAEALQRRGLLEDTRLGLELAVTAVFEAMRTAVRTALFLPKQQAAATASEVGVSMDGEVTY